MAPTLSCSKATAATRPCTAEPHTSSKRLRTEINGTACGRCSHEPQADRLEPLPVYRGFAPVGDDLAPPGGGRPLSDRRPTRNTLDPRFLQTSHWSDPGGV